jgi:hypothetical protein
MKDETLCAKPHHKVSSFFVFQTCIDPENRDWLACGCDALVAEGDGDASSPVGQPPANGGWEKCAGGGAFTLR